MNLCDSYIKEGFCYFSYVGGSFEVDIIGFGGWFFFVAESVSVVCRVAFGVVVFLGF